MKNLHLIDVAYNLAKSNFKNNKFEFSALWKLVLSDTKLSKEEADKVIGMFYTDLLSDKRFVFVGKNVWRLREFVPFNEYEDYAKNLFDFDDLIEEAEDEEDDKPKIDDSDDSEMEEDKIDDENNYKPNSTDDESDDDNNTAEEEQSDLEEIESDTEGTL